MKAGLQFNLCRIARQNATDSCIDQDKSGYKL